MVKENSDEKSTRHRAVRLSDLIGQESAPLSTRKADVEEDFEEEIDSEDAEIPEKSKKTPEKRGKKEKERPSAYDAAMNLLAFGDNSEKMLREKLARKGYEPSEIADALTTLREKRYISDARLMERYAAALSSKKYYGAYRIRMEMLRRFDRESVEAYFDDAIREIDFKEQAKRCAEKNARKGREYLIRRLRYLGYDREQIRAAVNQIRPISEE